MSIKIPISKLTNKQKDLADEITGIQLKDCRILEPYKIMNNNVYFPFGFATQKLKLHRPSRDKSIPFNAKFNATLRDGQKVVKKEAIKFLNKDGCVLLALFCGYGKTCIAINMACSIKMKTLVIVNKLVLIKQWKKSIEDFTNAVVQKLDTKSEFDDEADFYIMNAVNVPKMGHKFFSKIGLLIVDECHSIMAEQISYLMNYVQPRYSIGLSATPYRVDDLNVLLDLYFGSNRIFRKLNHFHKVFLVKTDFKPEMGVTAQGRVDYNSILKSISESVERNEIIVDLVKKYKDRNFLILVKRLSQGEYLMERLTDEGEYVDTLLGKKQKFDEEARILIGTASKVGTGFDHKKLDSLILGAPVKEYFIQFLGRVFRRKDITPFIFDLLDKNPILMKHYRDRKEIYKEHGGKIYPYSDF